MRATKARVEGSAWRWRSEHAADLHLDAPFAGIDRVAPGVAATLRDAAFRRGMR